MNPTSRTTVTTLMDDALAASALRVQEANRAAAEWQRRAINGEAVSFNLEARAKKQRVRADLLAQDVAGLREQLDIAIRLLGRGVKSINAGLVVHVDITAFLNGKVGRKKARR